jgi:chromosome segregation ATPase
MDKEEYSKASDIQSQLQLLKSLIQSKSSLLYEINNCKIGLSFSHSNAEFRDFKQLVNLSKIISSKLKDLTVVKNLLNSLEFKSISPESLTQISEIVDSSEFNISQIDQLLNSLMSSEKYLQALKEKHNQLSQEYEKKRKRQTLNDAEIIEVSPDLFLLHSLNQEIHDYQSELEDISQSIKKLEEKKAMAGANRRGSLEKIKKFHQMSEEALKLQSKTLMKKDLEASLMKAESQIDLHARRVEKDKKKLESLQEELNESHSDEGKLEEVLERLNSEVNRLESKIENYYGEREELINPAVLGLRRDTQEDSVTISLIGLMTGFDEMRREKDSLVLENLKLKEKITSLFGDVSN